MAEVERLGAERKKMKMTMYFMYCDNSYVWFYHYTSVSFDLFITVVFVLLILTLSGKFI